MPILLSYKILYAYSWRLIVRGRETLTQWYNMKLEGFEKVWCDNKYGNKWKFKEIHCII